MAKAKRAQGPRKVFVNCPFDDPYKPLFDAIVFAIHDLGFAARHALINAGEAIRLTRILKEIDGAHFSIHDLSRVESSGMLNLPRFNMPFEAGIAYHRQAQKSRPPHRMVLLDSKPYRYQASLSDAAGLDPKIHYEEPQQAMDAVRNFLKEKGKRSPGGEHLWNRYLVFKKLIRKSAREQRISMKELESWAYVNDLQNLMTEWITQNPP